MEMLLNLVDSAGSEDLQHIAMAVTSSAVTSVLFSHASCFVGTMVIDSKLLAPIRNRALLYSPGWPRTCCVEQPGLKLREFRRPLLLLGSKAYNTSPSYIFKIPLLMYS